MTNTEITYLILGVAALVCLGTWVWLVARPAWGAYSKAWERALALAGSLYVLVALLLAGGVLGAVVLYFYDRLPGA